jgi:hypothetical protein
VANLIGINEFRVSWPIAFSCGDDYARLAA